MKTTNKPAAYFKVIIGFIVNFNNARHRHVI